MFALLNSNPPETAKEAAVSAQASLVRLAARGDRGAFGELYTRFARMVHGMLLARVPPGEADDLVQDVFLSALRQLPELRDPEAFPGWLAAIARHRAADYYRDLDHASEGRGPAFTCVVTRARHRGVKRWKSSA